MLETQMCDITLEKFFKQQDNVHTNTESVQCISIVYSIRLYKYSQLAV